MSYEESLKSISMEADASIGIYTGVPGQPGSAVPNGGMQYRFLKLTGAHTVGICTAATDTIVGILQNKPQKPGAAATVGIYGVSNLVMSAAVSAGAFVAPTADGRGVTDATNGKYIALIAGTAANEMVPVLRVR